MIPWPTSFEQRAGTFTFGEEVPVAGPPELRDLVVQELGHTGIRWVPAASRTAMAETTATAGTAAAGTTATAGTAAAGTPTTAPAGVDLDLDPSLPVEGYRLAVEPDRVRIRGGGPAGVFYAIQTLKQLLPSDVYRQAPTNSTPWTLPCCAVEDAPAHGWRGCLLDVARHFMPKAFLLRLIDLLALHKCNVLQLHLTDDDGWRVQSAKYPRLTEVGGWREESKWWWEEKGDGVPHGGFYTQDDLREIVAYGARRFVTIVPEIEMPAHTFAAITAYPHLGNDPDLAERSCVRLGDGDVLNVEDSTVAFFQDVLEEVLEIFPSTFIHIGGDECPKDPWRSSERAQAKMRALGLTTEDELQSWFVSQMDAWLAARGRRLVGWDEILEGGLAPGATVMSWRGESGGVTAARAGHDVVMAPTDPTYFDYYQARSDEEPIAIGGYVPLEAVYAYEPVPAELAGTAEAGHVLGAQFQLWTEFLPAGGNVEYMAFPRACAFAEAVWRSARTDSYADFTERLRSHLARLDAYGVNYRPIDGPHPWQRGGTGRFNRPSQPQMVPDSGS